MNRPWLYIMLWFVFLSHVAWWAGVALFLSDPAGFLHELRVFLAS